MFKQLIVILVVIALALTVTGCCCCGSSGYNYPYSEAQDMTGNACEPCDGSTTCAQGSCRANSGA